MFEEGGMMMVPRSYLVREQQTETQRTIRRPSKSNNPSSTSDARRPSSPAPKTDPVKIRPQRRSRELTDKTDGKLSRTSSAEIHGNPRQAPVRKSFSAVSVDALLAETAIPIRKRPRGRKSQRLPTGDHVSDFSRLLSEDLTMKEEASLPGSLNGNPQFDLLFGAMGENLEDAMFVGSEGTTPRGLSVRSLSSDSLGSVDLDEASPGTSYTGATTPSITNSPGIPRSASYRKTRVFSTSEDCAEDHPLNSRRGRSPEVGNSKSETWSAASRESPSPGREPTKQRSTFRSNLTASLRALRSAASTVSNLAASNPANRPDDFLTRSLFVFNPELTDDRRPPPSSEVPSPALRRYLNPDLGIPDPQSPGLDFYSFSDSPPTNQPSTSIDRPHPRPRFPASIQLQTYLPPATRSSSGSASSPPRFGSPAPVQKVNIKPAANIAASSTNLEAGDLQASDEMVYNAKTSFHASPILSRQREPRENPDFLRVLVCEMQMKRRGKFGDNTEGRACVWLPPRREHGGHNEHARITRSRWEPLNADEI